MHFIISSIVSVHSCHVANTQLVLALLQLCDIHMSGDQNLGHVRNSSDHLFASRERLNAICYPCILYNKQLTTKLEFGPTQKRLIHLRNWFRIGRQLHSVCLAVILSHYYTPPRTCMLKKGTMLYPDWYTYFSGVVPSKIYLMYL